MDSNHGEPDPSAGESNYTVSNDGCTHLISTSLRDLSKKYEDLSHEQADPIELNKTDIGDQIGRRRIGG